MFERSKVINIRYEAKSLRLLERKTGMTAQVQTSEDTEVNAYYCYVTSRNYNKNGTDRFSDLFFYNRESLSVTA